MSINDQPTSDAAPLAQALGVSIERAYTEARRIVLWARAEGLLSHPGGRMPTPAPETTPEAADPSRGKESISGHKF